MQQVFSLVNSKCQNKDQVYCAVWSPLQNATQGVFLLEDAVRSNHIRLACFAINVRFNQGSGTTFLANNLLSGNHWGLTIIDLHTKIMWYGDSLGYPIPQNIDAEFEPVLKTLSKASGRKMSLSKQSFHVTNFDSQGSHVCSHLCKHFPPSDM